MATPRPDIADETYESSGIYTLRPTNTRDPRNHEIFIVARNSDGQFNPERWVRIPNGRLIEAANPVAADTLKSFAAPVPFDIPPETRLPPSPDVNIIQIRPPNDIGPRKVYTNSQTVVDNVPVSKQVFGIPPLPPSNVRKFVQQRIISEIHPVAFSRPTSSQIPARKSFAVPPPLPPPLKGIDVPPKVISSPVPVNIIPNSNVLVSNKNVISDSNIVPGKSVVQQVRHVWIPTSVNTGKFITIPISESIKTENSAINKGFSLDSTPVTVSDTWVLKQDGQVPVFRPLKTALPPVPSPIVQSGKVIFQDPTIVQIDAPTNPIITRIESPKNAPVVEKSVISNNARHIWPVRKELDTKVLYNYSPVIASDVSSAAVKSDRPLVEKPVAEYFTSPQKPIVTDTKSAFPLPFSSSNIQIVNGKPCPLPLPAPQKSSFSPLNAGVMSIPRILSTQRSLPFARIIRVNRYPTGSYYLLNRDIRPNYLIYPSQAVIQQPKTGLISLIQNKQLPIYFQRKIPVQTKQISIPVQSKQFASPLPAKQVTYPFVSRQVILPVAHRKSNRISFPTAQAIRFAYPWNGYLNSNPVIGKGAYIPEFSAFRAAPAGSESDSSSSESSSSEESSESSKEKKKEKSKKEKAKKEEKPKSGENSDSKESPEKESESESNSKSKEKESEEKSPEKESEESSENAES